MLTITPMRNNDLPQVVAIETASFALPKSEEVFRADEHKYLVAKVENQLVGYIGMENIVGEVHIINMAVHPGYRQRGVGRQLLASVLNDHDTFFLEVRLSNTVARKLYEQYGFQVISQREKYYQDNDETALVMTRMPK